jgi:hypothetical protein
LTSDADIIVPLRPNRLLISQLLHSHRPNRVSLWPTNGKLWIGGIFTESDRSTTYSPTGDAGVEAGSSLVLSRLALDEPPALRKRGPSDKHRTVKPAFVFSVAFLRVIYDADQLREAPRPQRSPISFAGPKTLTFLTIIELI